MGKPLRILLAMFALVMPCWLCPLHAQPENDKPQVEPDHWAFRRVARPRIPATSVKSQSAIDAFIVAALQAKGWTMNPPADRLTLIRRVSFDLTGLPPALDQIDAFINDKAADAYERMVDRYLASPRYGERWGKYWLDAAGYADSNGYFNADSDRPLAWQYRDYVIRSFNADKSYDRFIMEQLAGDELAGYRPDGDVTPEMAELLTATHFLRNAPDGTGESDGNPDEVRIDRYTVLEGNLQVAMTCLLGITIQCARCHRHKFEPISHAEYYSLQAILFPVYNPERWTKPNDRVVTVGTRLERTEWQRRTALIDRQIKALQEGVAALAEPLREQLVEERLKGVASNLRDKIIAAWKAPKGKQSAEQTALLRTHAQAVTISDDDLARRFPECAAIRDQARKTQAEREKDRPRPLDKLAVFVETDPKPPVHHILRRGQHNQPGDEVQPGVPAVLSTRNNVYRVKPAPQAALSSGRRTALARWLIAPENPLLARVMVNRIWQHHFGIGLVATPDNLGRSGARPSHRELLDYLASAFVDSGWSVKAIHRLILHSAVYRQASLPRPDLARFDADNRLLGRFPLRRLDAEAVRDALLHVAGELNTRMGGPYVPTRRTPEGTVAADDSHQNGKRRAVYLQQRRTQIDTLAQLFDAPTIVSNCSVRATSTVPLQALALLNSDFVRGRARAFSARTERESGPDAEQRLTHVFRLACARPPNEDERLAARHFLGAQRQAYAAQPDAEARAWTDLCQMVLASNAFLYVE
ncbi:MAG: DUF1553 domain-containing protein [Planctomycetes bacterium]|nr:DUF1553 domain-containing protein [Planctomycetota bacterium]